MAQAIVGCASDKKAENIVVLDMRKVANFCDYFVICTGNSDRQVRAVAEGISEGLGQKGVNVRYQQGFRDGHWVLLDLGTVVAHVFDRETREFYGLEHLWQEAKKVHI
ncbi:MAG: ribosome silencing factor [Candidatus Omnitrophota bacterium]|nr:ribosome silencing factor [Candidatus Omnitrophota bacterium]MDZ4241322.1 ribosome silencing factor [Candidatus Omnitrophota bacterium]